VTYRILIGVGDEELAATLRARFRELSDYAIVAMEPTSADLVATAGSDSELDVVLIHAGLGPNPAMETLRDIALRHPQLGIVLIANEASSEAFAHAMEAGARGVLLRDASVEELSSRLATAAEWSRSMRRRIGSAAEHPTGGPRGTVVALAGAKGGTGTTLLTVQLAMAAVAARRTICLIDLDLQTGDVPSYLDLTHRRGIIDLVGVSDDINGTILADTVYVHPAGPHVLLAPAEGERGEDVNARVVRQVIGALRNRYEVVLIDCGSYMTEASAMAVEVADTVVLTTTPDLPALRAGKRLAKMWARLQVRKEEDVRVALVKQHRRNEIQPDFAAKIIGVPVLRSTIPANFRVLEQAINTGTPTGVDDESFRRSVGQLAMEIGVVDQAATGKGGKAGKNARANAAPGGRRRDERGGVLVEFAGIVPFLGLILLIVWQIILVGLTSMYASHAANEGARAAAVLGTSAHYCPTTGDAKRACSTWKTVRERAVKRIAKPWYDKDHFDMKLTDGYVTISIDTPAVLPGIHTPWAITTQSKIVDEGGGGGAT